MPNIRSRAIQGLLQALFEECLKGTNPSLVVSVQVLTAVEADELAARTDDHQFIPDPDQRYAYSVYISKRAEGTTCIWLRKIVGAVLVRSDGLFYGSFLTGGNHDWSRSELVSSFKQCIKVKYGKGN